MGDRMAALRRLGCLLVPGFAAAAAVRAGAAVGGQPLVVRDEGRPGRRVLETDATARAVGIAPGMTEAAALARPGGVICRERVAAHEAAAQAALLEVALAHSPRVEEGGPGEVYLDAAGLGALFGDEAALARRLAAATAAAGPPARGRIPGSPAAAHLAAPRGAAAGRVPAHGDAAYPAPP